MRHRVRTSSAGPARYRVRFVGISLGTVIAVLIPVALLMGTAVSPAAAEVCPNEERRVEQGAAGLALPDCRAYEMVSPLGSLVSGLLDKTATARVSVGGDAVTYYTITPAPGADSSSYFYLANRGPAGWAAEDVGPQIAPAALFEDQCEQNVYFSPDLTKNIAEEGWFEDVDAPRCKRNQDVLVPGEPNPHRNVFFHDMATDAYRLVNVTPTDVTPANAKFQDASDDFSRILFSEEAKLTPDSLAGNNLFHWDDGTVRLVTYLPNGTPVVGELAEASGYQTAAGEFVLGSGLAPMVGATSADGKRVFFYAGNNLYLRLNADEAQSTVSGGECTEPALACTVQIDLSHGPGASGGGNFWRANPDASRVFFTSDRKLTPDSTAVSGRADLYEYNVDLGTLTDLTVMASGSADVRGVSGASDDGSYVYFVANGVLAPGAAPGTCRGSVEVGRVCNLYVAHDGSIDFIATLARGDRNTWQEATALTSIPIRKQSAVWANVSPSGRFLAFVSIQSLTGYDNRDINDSKLNRQIFLYDAAAEDGAGHLSCVSCIPGGARPDDRAVGVAFGGNYGPEFGWGNANWKTNHVLDDGRVFFDTEDGLVIDDVNGRKDVYEFHAGQHRLLTTGTYAGNARFLDVSHDGRDVFLLTPEPLVPSDTDNDNVGLYDVRIGGGFPEPPPPAPPCEGESCRDAVPAAPAVLLPGTSTFHGPGNKRTVLGKSGKRPCKRAKRNGKRRRCDRGKRRPAVSNRTTGLRGQGGPR